VPTYGKRTLKTGDLHPVYPPNSESRVKEIKGWSAGQSTEDESLKKFKTTRFGEIEYPDEVIMTFSDGVLGFPVETLYILLEHDVESSPFKWLQSLENPDLAFIVVDPKFVKPDYAFDIDLDTAKAIGTDDPPKCAVMTIINVPRDKPIGMTANLKAPLVVNVDTRNSRQIHSGQQCLRNQHTGISRTR
jgi:flagellar assembly factor FliW